MPGILWDDSRFLWCSVIFRAWWLAHSRRAITRAQSRCTRRRQARSSHRFVHLPRIAGQRAKTAFPVIENQIGFVRDGERAGGFSSASSMSFAHCHSYTEAELPAFCSFALTTQHSGPHCFCFSQVPAQPMYQPQAAVPTVCCPPAPHTPRLLATSTGTIRVALLPIHVFQGSQSAYVPEQELCQSSPRFSAAIQRRGPQSMAHLPQDTFLFLLLCLMNHPLITR